jgi:hypothetical protein
VHKTTHAPMIYTALCIMFWMRAYPLLGEVLGGWALEFESFLGHLKWHPADRRVPFGAHFPSQWLCTHPKHYARGCINHRCIKSYTSGTILQRAYSCTPLVLKLIDERGLSITTLFYPLALHLLSPDKMNTTNYIGTGNKLLIF